ncbi:immunoglobulin-like domain-containing protein [uncultured Anaerococcus sp.]|uniref:immunoglobulin-like domain-containing protein n=1 Tax=uncultured Anaerococcus sp. TaxID=293428 RepID=UPI0028895C8A|nr:immunoglobulin-like domain-containing protein [uncultured Anaerococcus sp.]
MKYLRKTRTNLVGILIFTLIMAFGSPKIYADGPVQDSVDTRVESAEPIKNSSELKNEDPSADRKADKNQDAVQKSDPKEVSEKKTEPEKVGDENSQNKQENPPASQDKVENQEENPLANQENGENQGENPLANQENAENQAENPSANLENNENEGDNEEALDLGKEMTPQLVSDPSQPSKTFTVKKKGAGETEETLVGEFDKFYEAVKAMGVSDDGNRYTIYVNKDVTVGADEMGDYYRSNNKFRLTSAPGGHYKLTRDHDWGLLGIQNNSELTIDNITLDGNNKSQCLFISNNGIVTIGNGATIQNFVDTDKEDGPAIYMTGGTLNILEGATIKDNSSNTKGGVIQAYNGTTVNISGGTFSNNESKTSDGGFLAAYGELNITGGKFVNNKAKKTGGAIIIGADAKASIENATFEKNQASTGGAIYSLNGLNIAKTSFSGNQANYGGAVFVSQKLSLDEVTFKENKAQKDGGALYLQGGAEINASDFEDNLASRYGGALLFAKDKTYTVTKSNISRNKSNRGGGIFAMGGNLSIGETTIEANQAAEVGGGILFLNGTSLSLNKTTIKVNSSPSGAGLVVGAGTADIKESEFNGNDTGEGDHQEKHLGGGLYVFEGAKVNISQNTKFINNKAGMGGAIFTANLYYKDPAKAESYKNLSLDNTSFFKGNLARAGLYLAPENYKDFKNLNFDPKSDTDHDKKLPSSLLNNYDINYQNSNVLVSYDANGGKFADGTELKQERKEKDKEITIIAGRNRQDYDFLHWEEPAVKPSEKYKLTDNHLFKAKWNKIPELEVKDAEIEEGQNLDPKDLITKAYDLEDGDKLADKVEIDKGSFDFNKPGIYHVKYTLTDKNGSKVTKNAKITVKKKSKPEKPEEPGCQPDEPEEPEKQEEPGCHPDEPEEPEKPEEPGCQPDEPEEKPEFPEVKPEIPEEKPEIPEVKPEIPEVKAEVSEGKTDYKVLENQVEDSTIKENLLVNPTKNPKTGVDPSLGLYSALTLVSSTLYMAIRKKY